MNRQETPITTPLLAPVSPIQGRRDLPAPGLSLKVAFRPAPPKKSPFTSVFENDAPGFSPRPTVSASFSEGGGTPTRKFRPPCLLKNR
jgi:hypothetical protein